MTRLIHPLFMLLAYATDKELVRVVEYLKEENRILRSKLPKRIEVTVAEEAWQTDRRRQDKSRAGKENCLK